MNTIRYQQFLGLPPAPFLTSLLQLHQLIFEGESPKTVVDELHYHAGRGPLLIDLALIEEHLVGYKIGYERKPGHFYSWLGGVDPDFRGLGIAAVLLQNQHQWCRESGYRVVRTQTYNQWRGMLILNLKQGFNIVGTQQGRYGY